MTEERKQQLIGQLKASQRRLSALLEAMADDQDWRPEPEQWSLRDIAAHMAMVEEDCHWARVRQIADGGEPHFEYYLNTGRDFSQLELRRSLRHWADVRQKLSDIVRRMPEEKWSLTGTHATFGTISVLDVLQLMLDHDQEHLQDLEQAIRTYKVQMNPTQ